MLAGIGILIFAAQFHVMLDGKPVGTGVENLVGLPGASITPSPQVTSPQRRRDRSSHHRRDFELECMRPKSLSMIPALLSA